MKRAYYGLIKCYNFYFCCFLSAGRGDSDGCCFLRNLKVYCLVLVEVHGK